MTNDFDGSPSAPDPLARVRELAKERELRNVHPGWWMRVYDGDKEEWLRVVSVAQGVHTPTQRKVTRVLTLDAESGEMFETFEPSNELVLCCTKAEAKRAGLGAS